jgi:hypothetical protein
MMITRRGLKEVIAVESSSIEAPRGLSLAQLRHPIARGGQMIHSVVPYGQISSVLGLHRRDLVNAWMMQGEHMVRDQISSILIELAEQIKEGDKTS